jgi:hypothetical protein
MPVFIKLFQKLKGEEVLPNSFYEKISITVGTNNILLLLLMQKSSPEQMECLKQ